MNGLSRVCSFAFAVVLLVGASPVHAIPLNAGDSVVYNFDFTSASPPPPYTGVQASIFFSPGPFDIDLVFLDGLDGTGSSSVVLSHVVGSDSVGVGVGDPGLNDGVFSIRITANVPLELMNVAGIGFALDGSLAFIDATLSTPAPEPATLALVGFGLLAAAAIRRRRG
jgi:hypothetical protein